MRLLYCVLCVMSLHTMAAEEFTLYFSRHGEKVTTIGNDPVLNSVGQQRAQALAEHLADKNIQDIYSSQYLRTQQTAAPLAKKLDQMVGFYDPEDLPVLARILRSQKRNALVVGHSNTTPQLINLVGGEASSIDENQYGDLFAVSFVDDQITTRVLPLAPITEGDLAPLAFDLGRLQTQKSRYRIRLKGEEIGYMVQDIVVKDEQVEITQITMASDTRTSMIVKTVVDKTTLLPKQIRMSGSDGKIVDVQLAFADNHVTGHSIRERARFLPQGQIDVDQWLPPFSYLKASVLGVITALKIQPKSQYFRWLDAGNMEIKRISLEHAGRETIVIDEQPYEVDVVHLRGGAPSYVFYITPEKQVVKFTIPSQKLVMESIPVG